MSIKQNLIEILKNRSLTPTIESLCDIVRVCTQRPLFLHMQKTTKATKLIFFCNTPEGSLKFANNILYYYYISRVPSCK